MSEIVTTLYAAGRLNNSVNGNPRFDLYTSHGRIRISSDAAVGYEVTNYTNRIDPDNPPKVVLSLTRAGRFYAIRYADES